MFNLVDTIKKRVISFESGSDYFKDDENIIKFEDIISYYHQEIKQFTNSVYEGNELNFTLFLKNQTKPYMIKIDSNKKDKYKQIYNLSHEIASFRTKNILKEFEENKVVEFGTLNDFKLILSKNNSLKLHYLGNKNHYEPFVVNKVKMKKNLLIFQAKNKRQEIISANSISDIALFLQLISTQNYFIDESKKIYKKEKKLYFIMMGLLVIFGLNGYFEFCCMENDFIDVISSLSMILLGVVVLTSPFFWFVGKWNSKKFEDAREYIVDTLYLNDEFQTSKTEIELFPMDEIYNDYIKIRKSQDSYAEERRTNQAKYLDENTGKEERIKILYEEVACQTAMLAYHPMVRDSDALFDMRDYEEYKKLYFSNVPNKEKNYIEYLKAYFSGLRESAIDDIEGDEELKIIKEKCKEAKLLDVYNEYMKNDK